MLTKTKAFLEVFHLFVKYCHFYPALSLLSPPIQLLMFMYVVFLGEKKAYGKSLVFRSINLKYKFTEKFKRWFLMNSVYCVIMAAKLFYYPENKLRQATLLSLFKYSQSPSSCLPFIECIKLHLQNGLKPVYNTLTLLVGSSCSYRTLFLHVTLDSSLHMQYGMESYLCRKRKLCIRNTT